MLNADGTQPDAKQEWKKQLESFPCEKALARLISALKELRTTRRMDKTSAVAVFHVFPNMSKKEWQSLAQKYHLEDWVAVPFDFTHENMHKNSQALFEYILAKENFDPLTKLPNRNQFENRLKAEMQRAGHTGTDLSVMRIAIDHAGDIKKRFGVTARDAALVKIAEIIRTCSRMYDLCARLVSDEFALILPGTPPLRALAMAERLRDHVHAAHISTEDGETFSVTFSAGIASLSQGPGLTPAALVEKAGEALCQAKQQGYDRVFLAGNFSDYDTKVQSSEKLFLFFGDAESREPSS